MKRSLIHLLTVSVLSVASVALGAPTHGLGNSQVIAAASSLPVCNGDNFWGAWVGKNGATGTVIYDVAFINDGRSSCRLGGYPTIRGYRNGHEYALKAGHLKGQPFDLSSTIVAPRMSGEMVLTTQDECNALNTGGQAKIQSVISDNSYSVSVTFPHSTGTVFINGLVLDVACGLNITNVGWR
jgi:hypothetical protein